MLYKLSIFFLLIFIMYIPRSDLSVIPYFSSHLMETSDNKRLSSSISDLPVSIPPQAGTITSLYLNSEKELFNPDLADLSVNPAFFVNQYFTRMSYGSSQQIMSMFLCLLLYFFIYSAMNSLKSQFLLNDSTFFLAELIGALSVYGAQYCESLRRTPSGLSLRLVFDLFVCSPLSLLLYPEQARQLSGGKVSFKGLQKLQVKSSLISFLPFRINQSPSSITVQLSLIISASLDFFPNTQSTLSLTTSSGKSGYFLSTIFLKVSRECQNGFIYFSSSSKNSFGYRDEVNLKISEQNNYFFWAIYFSLCFAMNLSQGPDVRIGLYITCWQSIFQQQSQCNLQGKLCQDLNSRQNISLFGMLSDLYFLFLAFGDHGKLQSFLPSFFDFLKGAWFLSVA